MQRDRKGWCIINIGHPNSGSSFISIGSFEYRKKDCIAKFIKNSGSSWRYWQEKYNFRCVKAKEIIQTL